MEGRKPDAGAIRQFHHVRSIMCLRQSVRKVLHVDMDAFYASVEQLG